MISTYNNKHLKKSNKKLSFLTALLLLSFFMSQFYFWKSGVPQFTHIFIAIAVTLFVFKNKVIITTPTKFLLLFIFYSVIVNLIWFFINNFDSDYFVSTSYWIFNFVLFALLSNLKDSNVKLLNEFLLKVIFLSYILEILLWAIGLGRYDFSPRYNGFFNDPNQMAFWVLSSCCIYLYISENKIKNLIIFSLAIFLILLTLSRSALLAIPFITVAIIAKQEGKTTNKIILSIASLVTILTISLFFYSRGIFDDIISRLIEGIDESATQAEDRGFDILLEYPEHLFFGAGQGGYSIYSPTSHEIHSTWFGIVFYYGVFGLFLFLTFLYQIFKKLNFSDRILFLGPMFYGFTTYSARTTIFWFVISVFFISKRNKA